MVRASHDRVVQLIRQSGDTLALKVVTVKPLEKPEHWLQHHNGTMTLPNRGGARRQGITQIYQAENELCIWYLFYEKLMPRCWGMQHSMLFISCPIILSNISNQECIMYF